MKSTSFTDLIVLLRLDVERLGDLLDVCLRAAAADGGVGAAGVGLAVPGGAAAGTVRR